MTTDHGTCPSCNGLIGPPDADAALRELQRVRQQQAEAQAAVTAALRLLDEEVTDPCPEVAAARALLRSVAQRGRGKH